LATPLIGVCIPTYNSEKYIEKTLESVLNQTYQKFEIIIVDDDSTDETVNIIKSIKDQRIKIFNNQKNVGPSKTWNRLLLLANGDYVKILCHDDILYQDSLKAHIDVFLINKGIALSVSNRDIINPTGKIITSVNQFKKSEQKSGKQLFLDSIKTGKNVLGEPHALVFNNSIIKDNNITFGENFYLIDLEFYSKILLFGDAFVLNQTLSAFRISKESASYKLANEQAKQYIQFVKTIAASNNYSIGFVQKILIYSKAKLWQALKNIYYFIYL